MTNLFRYAALLLCLMALTVVTHSEDAAPASGFTIKISLIDFFMIQRGLMLLPDDHAKETLAKVRAQMSQSINKQSCEHDRNGCR